VIMPTVAQAPLPSQTASEVTPLLETIERDGAVVLPPIVSESTLREMQDAFASRLRYFRCNNVEGYQRGERMRLMVEDVLTLAQGFVDIGLHPLVVAILNQHLGQKYTLCETKGWETLKTKTDFHGWHSDSWYDQTKVRDCIPREIKLAFYLSDVRSGAFQYLKGTHRKRAPYHPQGVAIQSVSMKDLIEFNGPAGTAILFDTSGIHRQGVPVLESRRAVFYNYHDPSIPLQKEDLDYYRYHPLLLNAALLGDLTPEHVRVLGLGKKGRFQPNCVQKPAHPWSHAAVTHAQSAELFVDYWFERVVGKIARVRRSISRR